MTSILKHFLITIGIFSSLLLLAQPPAPPATPIDGGLGLLLAGGAVYGFKRLMRRKDESE